MLKTFLLPRIAAILAAAAVCLAASAREPRAESFNACWRFSLADGRGLEDPAFDDSAWRLLDLPHDWAIEGDFSIDNPSGPGGGALPGGIGWYRKRFTAPALAEGETLHVDFDGAYMNSSVFINGTFLGKRPYGYASFSYDLTPYLRNGENVIAVRVDNAEQPNSRWYSGCGIYRNVWLRRLPAVHVPLWGQHVMTRATDTSASADIVTTVENAGRSPAKVTVRHSLAAPDGTEVASALCAPAIIDPGASADVAGALAFADPALWSPDSPSLYVLSTVVADADTGETLDSYSVTTGFKYCTFDAQNGFSLNGKPMKINGVCMHHDLGALGAAVNRRAIERQLGMLKDMGANAYRCSHNPPAPEVLDLCDRMGLLVMDEPFDMWRKRKTAHDYSRYFPEWHERDLADLVRRDRNHPSLFMWSIGNEVLEQWDDNLADTLTLEQANLILNFGHSADALAEEGAQLSINSLLARKLADIVKALDPLRPVTAGCNEPAPGNHLFRSGALDIIGYNYHDSEFAAVPQRFPGLPFVITESVSALMTRGHYRMPSDSAFLWPVRWDIPFEDPSFMCSSYDNCHAPWGNRHEGTLAHVDANPFIMGQFIWTGFDYLGEPTPYGWPARSSYFGIVDLAGFPKDIYYMYQSQWRPDKTVLHIFPHWNHAEGDIVDVWAYYNNADEVELFLNGRSLGVRTPEPGKYHADWRVAYTPGTLRAVSRRGGNVVAVKEVRTAGEPCAIRLTPDRADIAADGLDLSFVTAEVVDSDGNLCPLADHEITFAISGNASIEGVDNGLQTSLERFKADHRKAFNGKALLIVRPAAVPGDIIVTATSPVLRTAAATLRAR